MRVFKPRLLHLQLLLIVAMGLSMSFSGCGCVDDTGFNFLPDDPDAGPPEEEPPPPVFPLKAGDVVVYTQLGGRTGAGIGEFDRVIKGTYTVEEVILDEDTNTWSVKADYLYELMTSAIGSGEMAQLFISGVGPFSSLDQGGAEDGNATFFTDSAPHQSLTPNGFPFFHFESEYATREDSAYQMAPAEFREKIKELDPDANIDSKAADAVIEAYFKDDRGGAAMLHKISVTLHPWGFIDGWDERLIPWNDNMQRSEGDFAGQTETIPLAAVFPGNIRVVRGDDTYICWASKKTCEQLNDSTTCLPKDPADDPTPCVCVDGNPDNDDGC
jgi:hypothetical protein